MLSEFLRWWLRQWASLLPAGLHPGADARRRLVVTAGAPDDVWPARIVVAMHRRRQTTPSEVLTLDGAGRERLRAIAAQARGPSASLCVPASAILRQTVVLPLAAERDIGRVLRYEMDRITPFSPDEVFWTWTIESRDRAADRLCVRLALVPKPGLAPLLDTLRQAGVSPTVLETSDAGLRLPLTEDRAADPSWWHRSAPRLATACLAGLLLAAVVIPFLRQAIAIARIEDRIEALRPSMDLADALRRRITARAASTDAVAAQRAMLADAVGAIATLTALLPDDTFVTDLTLRGRTVTFSGRTEAAARVLTTLSSDPALRNTVFSAPVTRDETRTAPASGPNHPEGFSIRAEIAP